MIVAKKAKNMGKRVVGIFGIMGESRSDLLDPFDFVIIVNKENANVHAPGFTHEIGPLQMKRSGAALSRLLKSENYVED